MTRLLIILFIFFLASCLCGQTVTKQQTQLHPIKETYDHDTTGWLTPSHMTPFTFLETMKKKGNVNDEPGVVVMADSFPDNWIQQGEIDSLMKLINSKEKCNCFLNPLSSNIPSEDANIGGYAIALIKAFKNKRRVQFGLYSCPKTNKQDVEVLTNWWTNQNK